ncbi:MAG: hypothetical protein Q9223_000536 [Gallowayella weberi]
MIIAGYPTMQFAARAELDLVTSIKLETWTPHFLPAEDVSDSAEEDMEVSDAEDEVEPHPAPPIVFSCSTDGPTSGFKLDHAERTVEPPAKRRATAAAKDSKQEASVPQWSNPDPYTVLPPVDEAQRKRKDVVKIIRKARIVAEKETTIENQVAANDDFISLGNIPDEERRSSSPTESDQGPELPTGPRSFSHLSSLHGPHHSRAPGTSELRQPIKDLGPPPGLTNGSRAEREPAVRRREFYPEQAEALGNRKRTHDDEIKGEAIKMSVRGRKPPASGSLLRDWKPLQNVNPTPWIVDDHRATANAGFRHFHLAHRGRLHKEVCDFYEFVRPQRFEQVIREDLLQRLQKVVAHQLPGCNVHCFGSFAAAMYLPNADMDLVVISQTFKTTGRRAVGQSADEMYSLAKYLQTIGLASIGSVEVIPKAKVPLVKFVDLLTGIRVDISFDNETGLIANDTFNVWKQQYPAMPILTTIIKQILMMRGLNEVVNGGLGGFSVTCLVTSLLQNLPRVQNGEVIPEQHLGEMLLELLDLYGKQFDLDRTGISMNPPGYYDKQAAMRQNAHKGVYNGNQRLSKLAILDPNNPGNDISGGSGNVLRIFDLFSRAYNEIMEAMKSRNRISLLDWALGGNYRNFTVQRERLRALYEARWGDLEAVASAQETIPPRTIEIGLNSMDGSREDNAMASALPANIYSNPLDSDVIAEPKSRRQTVKKTRRGKRTKKKPCTSNPQGDRQLTGTSLRNALCRAGILKERFPSVAQDIPRTITKQEEKTLTKQFMAAGLVPQAQGKIGDLSARQSMLRKVDKKLKAGHVSKQSKH